MKYQYRKGIVMARICGEYLLIPTREASEDCPEVVHLTLFGATVLEAIENSRDLSKISGAFQKLTGRPAPEVDERINTLLNDFYEKGYLVRIADDT